VHGPWQIATLAASVAISPQRPPTLGALLNVASSAQEHPPTPRRETRQAIIISRVKWECSRGSRWREFSADPCAFRSPAKSPSFSVRSAPVSWP